MDLNPFTNNVDRMYRVIFFFASYWSAESLRDFFYPWRLLPNVWKVLLSVRQNQW